MPYIGKEPTTGNFIYADDITTSATNTYNILVGGVAFSPQSSSHVICSLNGVIQKGGGNNPSFTISGSQITFLPSSGTLTSSDSIDFILILGSVNDVGVATTVSDSAITKSKLNLISDSSSAGLTVKGDGSSENGTIQLNCSQNSHGVKISSPAHSAGQSYELILPTGNVTADKVLKVASVSGSGATGIGQLSFGDAGGQNTPNFFAYLSANRSSASSTEVEVVFPNELYDTASAYDTSTGRFTVPSGQGGKYFVKAVCRRANWSANRTITEIRINGSATNMLLEEYPGTVASYGSAPCSGILNVSAGDYISVYYYHDNGSTQNIYGTATSNGMESYFAGYKLIE